jgi:ferrochelatase
MRHWRPFIKETVAEMARDGIQHIMAICMAPHYSLLSIGKYREKLEEAVAAARTAGWKPGGMTIDFVEHWHTQPHYLQALADNVRQTLARWPAAEQSEVKIVFTAHSLPTSILQQGDPYDAQLRETAALLADRLALPAGQWTFSYQSAAKTGVPWLGPQIEDLVVELAAQGDKNLLIAPIGFIADHVEVLYDIDIGLRQIADRQGVRLERPPMLNDSPAMITILADLVRERPGQVAQSKL